MILSGRPVRIWTGRQIKQETRRQIISRTHVPDKPTRSEKQLAILTYSIRIEYRFDQGQPVLGCVSVIHTGVETIFP
jgi:hypothetical protein